MKKFYGMQAFGPGMIIRLRMKISMHQAKAIAEQFANISFSEGMPGYITLEGYLPSADVWNFLDAKELLLADRDLIVARSKYYAISRRQSKAKHQAADLSKFDDDDLPF